MALPENKVWRDSDVVYVPVWKDNASVPIGNSSKLPYPKPTVEPISVGVIHGIVYKSSYTDADYRNELDAVNTDTWRAWTAGEAWVSRILTDTMNVDLVDIVEVHYIIRCTKRKWEVVFPDIGYVYVDAGVYKSFVDADGIPYIGKLDNAGAEQAVGSNHILRTHAHHPTIAFSALGF